MSVFQGAAGQAAATAAVRPAPEERAVDLSALTVAQLRALCEEHGVDAPRRATKAQLVSALTD